MLDIFITRQFAKDESGRLVFLPRGPSRAGYYVGAADESKLKALVKVYGVAAALINLTGSTASYAFTTWLTSSERSAPLASRLKFGLIVYAISASILYIGPALLLWNVYRREVALLCSSLDTVAPASIHLTSEHSSARRTALVFLFAGLLVLALGIFAAVSLRR
jgi:hypothetical protein